MAVAANQKNSRILIFGTGAGGINFYKSCRGRYNVVGFLDNNQQKHGQALFGKTIHNPQHLHQLHFDQIIIASDYYREIYPQLVNELAIREEQISIFHNQLTAASPRQRLIAQLERWGYALMCRQPGLISDLLYRLFFSRQRDVRRFALCWLDEADSHKVQVLRPAQPGSVQGPRFVAHEVAATAITLPEVALYHFINGQVCSVSRSVILPGGRLVAERVVTAKSTAADYSGAHLLYHGQTLALVRQAPQAELIEKGLLVTGGSEVNYYHWVLEILSQLQFIGELPGEYDDYPLLISGHSQNIPAIKALIGAIGSARPVVFLKSVAAYCVTDLLLVSAPNNCITNYKGESRSIAENSFARPESINFLRGKALSLAADIDPGSLPKRVFLGRKGFLRPYNQSEILARLEPLGFVCVYMEEQDIHHQVAIMANADIIIGPTGAAWTNIIFATRGARALCWMAEEAGAISFFSNLAAIVGVEMDYIPYQAQTSDSREIYYKGYTIEPDTIVAWLTKDVPVPYSGTTS
ncbi:capsular polysaccharide biosynthesis protein [Pseudomonas sp. JUb42]|jgi:capsular polysaccharide biosynthesis protein|uniref:glycosyltransferase family 61 protein n=1 Tax=Pseudomonas sp. JUb42 TaxID=2940611 RepID=UPI002169862A|nr:glycosyltransferase 61 family protein [Pseudomonas sp. JUb42]MCS3469746.1 capsular polysaccharide biosynthesis protein [Pseudomonas sp. JUb42]